MKKSISLAIYAIMMAIPVFFASCGNDDLLDDEPEVQKPTITSWTEPWHIQGSTMDEVKNLFTTSDKSTVNTTSKVSDDCFNVSYSFVTR